MNTGKSTVLTNFDGRHMRRLTVKNDSTLLEFLYSALAPQSRTSIKSLLSGSRVEVRGKAVTAFDLPLRGGDTVVILDKAAPAAGTGDRRLKIVYEDDWLIVADKACGLPTISTGKENEVTAYSILTEYVRSVDRNGRVFIVHRIDRETSGLIVFAKDERTKRILQDGWNETVTERKYAAVAEGMFAEDDGRMVSWLKENPKSLKMSSCPFDNGGKKAITSYRVTGRSHGMTSLELELETGRKNQIRVQLASIGHPLAGDRKYGAVSDPFLRLALHARSIAFKHPHTGREMRFETENPFKI